VLMNAAAALLAAGKAADLAEGVALARESIDSGNAAAALEALGELSRRMAAAATRAKPTSEATL
jgi:anthranilate phosphoribosyltransferase